MMNPVVENAAEIGKELDRVTASRLFINSARLIRFLRFTVDTVLNGHAHLLKEHFIGTHVYDRSTTYDPRIDPVVRVEARRLRQKLRKYYETTGSSTELKIDYPIGSYVPVFLVNGKAPGETESRIQAKRTDEADLYIDGDGMFLAIFPFVCQPGTEEDVRFSTALTDELIYRFSLSSGFRVAAITHSYEEAHSISPAHRLATDLGAHAFMQGQVRSNGDRYRITIQLYDSAGFGVWTDRFDLLDHATPCVPDRVACAIAARCHLDYSLLRSMTVSPSLAAVRALGIAARARREIDERDPVTVSNTLRLLSAAVARCPNDTGLHSALADGHVELFLSGATTYEVAYEAAKPAVNRSLALDSISSAANCAAAAVQGWLRWNWPKAMEHVRLALKAGASVRAFYLYAMLLTYHGQFDEALKQLNRAADLDAFSQSITTAIAHTLFLARRYESLIEAFPEKDSAIWPIGVVRYLGLAYAMTGSREKAIQLIERLIEPALLSVPHRTVFAEMEAWAGHPRRASLMLGDSNIAPIENALLAVAIGDHATAIASLEVARRRRNPIVLTLQSDSRFDALRRYDRFRSLAKQSRVVLE
ncbi:hypothetical protein PQQ86_32550 [Paraburkholderia sediminicola]|uniref:hypothetical protein n=1 Tax=Paraburkholderia sediminicola TaxID=458836 RepID=UPI0038BB4E9E